jgi:phosphoribosylformylglycinamidine synthase
LRVRGTRRGIAAKVDCNGRFCYLNPRRGAMIAVAEAARNVACVGARPRAITNNLNFGNPLKPEVYYQLRECVQGMAEACRVFQTPVTGGNVSLYNENPRGAIYPTPVVGMIGVLDDVERHVRATFQTPGDAVLLLGTSRDELGGTEYLKVVFGLVAGDVPQVDLQHERSLQHVLVDLAEAGLLRSAHDCAEGGLAVALAESAMANDENMLGLEVELHDELPTAALLFGESQGRVVISCAEHEVMQVIDIAEKCGVPCRRIGRVGEPQGNFVIRTPETSIKTPVANLAEVYFEALPRLMHSAADRG